MTEIKDWIKSSFEKGFKEDDIIKALEGRGWKLDAINAAFYDLELERLAPPYPVIDILPPTPPVSVLGTTPEPIFNKLKHLFVKKENSSVTKCPKCSAVMVSQDVQQFITEELKALSDGKYN